MIGTKVFAKIDKLLPKSRYAKYDIDNPIDFVKASHGNKYDDVLSP